MGRKRVRRKAVNQTKRLCFVLKEHRRVWLSIWMDGADRLRDLERADCTCGANNCSFPLPAVKSIPAEVRCDCMRQRVPTHGHVSHRGLSVCLCVCVCVCVCVG